MKERFIINHATTFIVPEYDDNGYLFSRILHGNETFLVKEKPFKLIERSVNYYGNTIKGAIEASRVVLGNHWMSPLTISEKLEIYWFPTSGYEKDECAWFALDHIKYFVEIDKNQTRIIFRNGCSLDIPMNKKRLIRKRNQSAQLKHERQIRVKWSATYLYVQKQEIMFTLESGERNYRIKRDDYQE